MSSISISGTIISIRHERAMTDTLELDRLPLLPRDKDGPVFAEAWQAQVFAMTIELSRQGRFTWSEWATALAGEIAAAQARGDADLGNTYYHHWLAALERLVAAKKLLSARDLAVRKEAWRHAAAHTEFGQPIVLRDE
jgi:nitrile hydratase accessory protein